MTHKKRVKKSQLFSWPFFRIWLHDLDSRPRLHIVEAGNSFRLFADYAKRQGLTVNRVKLAPGSGVSLAPFADASRLIAAPAKVKNLDAE